MLTPEEIEDLRALGEEMAAAEASAYEPECLARVFATPAPESRTPVLTMQRWMDLSAIRSPLLDGRRPETLDELEKSAAIFELSVIGLEPEDAFHVANVLERTIREAFAMQVEMRRPESEGTAENGGFGAWLPMYTCMVVEMGIPRAEVLQMDVREVYALLAAARWNNGWRVTGATYAQREILNQEEGKAGKEETDHGG